MGLMILRHKDIEVASFLYDDSNISKLHVYEKDHMPFFGSEDIRFFKKWIDNRMAPASRTDIQKLLKNGNLKSTKDLLIKNYALSLSDCYFISPADKDIAWDDINLYQRTTPTLFYEQTENFNPAIASLGGNQPKKWVRHDTFPGKWSIIKENEEKYPTQAINEAFASKVCDLQKTMDDRNSIISHVPYHILNDNYSCCICPAFTDDKTEFVSAYECVGAKKEKGDISYIDLYAYTLNDMGLDLANVYKFLDFQTMFDFAITNTDRHLNNMGVLRDPDSLKVLGVAPIFDNGNSMFYDSLILHDEKTIKDIKITSFLNKETKMLKKVRNRQVFNPDKLPDKATVKKIYIDYGCDEERARRISHNYSLKTELIHDFVRGKEISTYEDC